MLRTEDRWRGIGETPHIHANSFVPAGEDACRERVSGYMTRSSIASRRLSLTDDRNMLYQLRRSPLDGTTAVSVQPLDFIARQTCEHG